jgi:hypothetical protein
MAITKTYINGDFATLYNWLVANGSDFFTSIVNNTSYISCYVEDLEFIKIRPTMSLGDSGGINIITAGGIDTSLWRGSSQNKIMWAYKTSTSLAFSVYNYDAQDAALFSIIITKDSNGDVCAVVVNKFIPSLVGDNSVYAISTTSELVNTTILRPNIDKYATSFCPLIVSGTTV